MRSEIATGKVDAGSYPGGTSGWRRRAGQACALMLSVSVCLGCETISDVMGAVGVAKDVGVHLEKDLKTPLSDQKISKVLTIIPSLSEFSKDAKVKWKPDPSASDMTQLATSLAGLSDYISFFESHDTRITEFYTDFVKIADARARLQLKQGQADAKKRLKQERKKLQEKLADAEGKAKKKLERQLKQNRLTAEKLEQQHEAGQQFREQTRQTGYQLTEDEVGLVKARLPEIDQVFEKAGYGNNKAKK